MFSFVQRNARAADRQRGLLRSFDEEWTASYAGFQRHVASRERRLARTHEKQLDALAHLLERARIVPPQYSHDLLALRWLQRTLFMSDKLTEARVLGEEARAVEAAEMEDASARVERDNLTRMSALYKRHVNEAEELARRAAERDRALLQAHLKIVQSLVSAGVKAAGVKGAREAMAKHLRVAEQGVTKDAAQACKASDVAFVAVASTVKDHLQKLTQKAPVKLPRDEDGQVDWMKMPEPPKSVLEANGFDRVARASKVLARAMARYEKETSTKAMAVKGHKTMGVFKLGGMGSGAAGAAAAERKERKRNQHEARSDHNGHLPTIGEEAYDKEEADESTFFEEVGSEAVSEPDDQESRALRRAQLRMFTRGGRGSDESDDYEDDSSDDDDDELDVDDADSRGSMMGTRVKPWGSAPKSTTGRAAEELLAQERERQERPRRKVAPMEKTTLNINEDELIDETERTREILREGAMRRFGFVVPRRTARPPAPSNAKRRSHPDHRRTKLTDGRLGGNAESANEIKACSVSQAASGSDRAVSESNADYHLSVAQGSAAVIGGEDAVQYVHMGGVATGRRPGMTLPPPPSGLFTTDDAKAKPYKHDVQKMSKNGIILGRVGCDALAGVRGGKAKHAKMYSIHDPPPKTLPRSAVVPLRATRKALRQAAEQLPPREMPLGATAANFARHELHRQHLQRRLEVGLEPPPVIRRDRSMEKERLWIQPRKERCDPYADRERKPAWYEAYQGRGNKAMIRRVVRVTSRAPNPHKGATAAAAARMNARDEASAYASASSGSVCSGGDERGSEDEDFGEDTEDTGSEDADAASEPVDEEAFEAYLLRENRRLRRMEESHWVMHGLSEDGGQGVDAASETTDAALQLEDFGDDVGSR